MGLPTKEFGNSRIFLQKSKSDWASTSCLPSPSAGSDPKSVLPAGLRCTRNMPFIQHMLERDRKRTGTFFYFGSSEADLQAGTSIVPNLSH